MLLGKCKTQIELNEICRIHESLKVKYTTTLYDSRCIILGINDGPNTPTFVPPSFFKSRGLFYATDGEESVNLEDTISEFLSSIFWVLESKRHERSREKVGSDFLICLLYVMYYSYNNSKFLLPKIFANYCY